MKNSIITLKGTDKLTYKDAHLFVNGKPFITTEPDESLDWIQGVENNQLKTRFHGKSNEVLWDVAEISGYYMVNTEDTTAASIATGDIMLGHEKKNKDIKLREYVKIEQAAANILRDA